MKLTIVPDNIEVHFEEPTKLYTLLVEKAGYKIRSSCGGYARCGECKVKIISPDAEFRELSFNEKSLLGNVFHLTRERLSCQMLLNRDCVVDISEHIYE